MQKVRIAQLAGDEESDEKSKTFIFHDEGHTLGNALRCVISNYPNVSFCGYTIPHPDEAKMNFRIQVRSGTAVDTLKQGLEDLINMGDHIIKVFEEEVTNFKATKK